MDFTAGQILVIIISNFLMLQEDQVARFQKIDFDKERKALFSDDPEHYENLRKWREELDKI